MLFRVLRVIQTLWEPGLFYPSDNKSFDKFIGKIKLNNHQADSSKDKHEYNNIINAF